MGWDDALTDLRAHVFAEFGREAIYTPSGGAAQVGAVSVLLTRADAQIGLGAGFRDLSPGGASEWTIEVRASEIAGGVVSRGDKFAVTGSGTFIVSHEPIADVMNAEYNCQVRKTT